LPVLSGRLSLLGTEPSASYQRGDETQLGQLHVDTAANAKAALPPAVRMVGETICVYGANDGVPCSTEDTTEENRQAVLHVEQEFGMEAGVVGRNGWVLFPDATKRIQG
jgi:hypothetical protein